MATPSIAEPAARRPDAATRPTSRWDGIVRPYTHERRRAAPRLGRASSTRSPSAGRGGSGSCSTPSPTSHALGALTGNQAVQRCAPGSRRSTSRGWQVAADANLAGQMYPDQSLYPADSVPRVVRRINQALLRADQIEHAEGKRDARLVRADRRRRRGRLRRAAQRLRADEGDDRGRRRRRPLRGPARLARRSAATWAARCWCRPASSSARWSRRGSPPTCWTCRRVLVARTDADSAKLLTSDVDPRDRAFLHRRAHRRGLLPHHAAASTCAIARGLAYAPYADLIWCETSHARPRRGASASPRRVHARVPRQAARLQLLAVVQLEEEPRRRDDRQVPARAGRDGLQVPVRHAGRLPRARTTRMFELARGYRERGMAAYSELQQARVRRRGATATPPRKHQREVGTGYFDDVAAGDLRRRRRRRSPSTESTEAAQF